MCRDILTFPSLPICIIFCSTFDGFIVFQLKTIVANPVICSACMHADRADFYFQCFFPISTPEFGSYHVCRVIFDHVKPTLSLYTLKFSPTKFSIFFYCTKHAPCITMMIATNVSNLIFCPFSIKYKLSAIAQYKWNVAASKKLV